MARLLLVLVLAATLAAGASALKKPPVYKIPTGAALTSLPGAKLLMPSKQLVTKLSLSLSPVTFQLTLKNKTLVLQFTSPAFISDSGKKALAFGPTLRINRGGTYSVQIANQMVDPNPEKPGDNAKPFYGPMDTNFHSHGLHFPTGAPSQVTASTKYIGGDNVFIKLPAKVAEADKPSTITFNGTLPSDHFPGLNWYHPHKHGSTTIQTSTAHGAILVNDDFDVWMPISSSGCDVIRQVLAAADDVILDTTLLFFQYAALPGTPNALATDVDNANIQVASNISNNPYCCSKPDTNGYAFQGTATGNLAMNMTGQDIYLINGGYQPQISMQSDTWQRWRFLYSGAKGFIAITIATADNQVATPDCEMMLIGKDALYLPRLPRKIPGIVLPAGGRVEVLARCSGGRGTGYVLTAGPAAVKVFSDDGFNGNPYLQQQAILATIKMKGASGKAVLKQPLVEEACVPKRPSYASDLRDAALAAASYPLGDVVTSDVQFTFNRGYACEVNGDVYSYPDLNPLLMPLGKVVQWSFNDVFFHVLHVHANPFQLVAINETINAPVPGNRPTSFYKVGDWYDTFLYPFNAAALPGSYQLRFQPGQYTGYSLMHCHYLQHEDAGCMKEVLFQCPGHPTDQPADGFCPGFTFPVPGTVVV